MQKTVYFLEHRLTGRRLKWYHTLAGARIAQRSRNHRLGFLQRIQRTQEAGVEYELCSTLDADSAIATYCIRVMTIEQADLE